MVSVTKSSGFAIWLCAYLDGISYVDGVRYLPDGFSREMLLLSWTRVSGLKCILGVFSAQHFHKISFLATAFLKLLK